jgi:cellulose synthase/poly-beta-1,6-N-acetylglucosamine synthase-like glycosyltransferase
MNKKSMYKIKVASILFLVALTFLFFILFSLSSAVTDKSNYVLEEKVKIFLPSENEHNIKIITPSQTYLKKTSSDLIFMPEEAGEYNIIISSEKGSENHKFNVRSEDSALKKESNQGIVENKSETMQEEICICFLNSEMFFSVFTGAGV